MDLLIDEKSSLNKDAEPKDEYSELCYNSDDDNELGNYETNDNTKNDSNENKSDNIVIASAFLPFDLIKNEINNKWEVNIVDNPFYNSLYKLSENNPNILIFLFRINSGKRKCECTLRLVFAGILFFEGNVLLHGLFNPFI